MDRLPLNKIICGDNCEVMATFPDDSIDLVVTSPPYDNLRTYGGHAWDFEGLAEQLRRVIKTGGVVVWVVSDATLNGSETGTSFRQALHFMDIGFRLHDTMIWNRESLPLTHNRYEQAFEYMFVLSIGKPTSFNGIKTKCIHAGQAANGTVRQGGDEIRGLNTPGKIRETKLICNIWKIRQHCTGTDPVTRGHPAVFPMDLARDHILSWSNEGDVVLDPFNGSGTTTKMAKHMGRQFIGIEINKEYCDIANRRLAQGVLF